MTKLEVIYFVFVSILTVLLIIGAFIFSYIYNNSTGKSSQKKLVIKRKFSVKTTKSKDYMINELLSGKIKCHTMPNSAERYRVRKWVNKMFLFMKQPSFDELMNLKGRDIDGD